MGITAKSVVFDFADDWGGTATYLGIRRVEFLLDGSVITMTSGFTAYATSTINSSYLPAYAFNTSGAKTGNGVSASWFSNSNNNTNQRLIIVFDSDTEFDKIIINNCHNTGSYVDEGVQNAVITASTDEITSTVYQGTITNATVLFDGEISIHPATDTVDDQTYYEYVEPPSGITAKSVVFDFADDWGGTATYMGIRSIEFWFDGSKITMAETTDFVAYATSQFSNDYRAALAFDTSKSKTGSWGYTSWVSSNSGGNHVDQRLIIVFDSDTEFDKIVINNLHNSGNNTNEGVQNAVITASTDEITSTVYQGTITNATVLFDGVFGQHINSNVADDQVYYTWRDPNLWTPAEITTALWLDAADRSTITPNGSTVAQIDDKSGNDNHATQTSSTSRPTMTTLNGEVALNFDGSDDYLSLSGLSSLTAATVFMVVELDADPPIAAEKTGLWKFGTASFVTHFPYTDSVIYDDFGTTARKTVGNPSPSLTSPRIYSVTSESGNWVAMLDGNTTALHSTATNTVGFASTCEVGRSSSGYYLDGRIGELIIASGVLSETDRQKTEGYLAWKWGLEENLPSGHPYEDAAPTLPVNYTILSYWEQLYDLEASIIENELEQLFHLTSFLLNDVELLYGGPLQNTIRQFYSSVVPKVSRIDQWYSSASILSESLVVNYGYNQAFAASFDQEYFIAAELLKDLVIKYNLNVGTINANIVTNYNLSERSGIQAGINQKYHISSTVNAGTVDFNIVIEGLTW